jgi:hypothetical protein
MLTNQKPVPTRHDHPCGICGDTSTTCREIEAGWLCHDEIDGLGAVPGYRWLRPTKDGVWGVWVPSANNLSERDRAEWLRKKRLSETHHRAESLTAVVRDRLYKDLINELTIADEDLEDLLHRGFTFDQIEENGYRSIQKWHPLEREYPIELPGISRKGMRSLTNCEPGYICPARDENGLVTGLQYRLRESGDGGRYRWLSSAKSASVNLPNGEPPLSIFRTESEICGFAEGTGPKPHLASLLFGINVIGASGRSWCSSTESLRQALKEIAPKSCILYPDAGADHHTTQQYGRLHDQLKLWGHHLQVAWWGQRAKARGDIDEISEGDRANIQLIDWNEYLKLMNGPEISELPEIQEHEWESI